MSSIRHKLIGWLRDRTEPRPAAFPVCPPWTDEDRDAWARFLTSITGRKLIERKRALGLVSAIQGAKDVFHTAHSAGKTVGWDESTDWLISLTQTKEEPKEQVTDDRMIEETPEELLARMTP